MEGFQKHQRRMDKSHFVSFKVGLLPVVVQQKIKDVRAFALSRFSFGWAHRFPLVKWCQGVHAKIWKAIGCFQFSIQKLKQIIVGGHMGAFASTMWRLVRLSALGTHACAKLGKAWPIAALDGVSSRLRGLGSFSHNGRWAHSLFVSGVTLLEIQQI